MKAHRSHHILYTPTGKHAKINPEDVWERVPARRNGRLVLKGTRLAPMDVLAALLVHPETFEHLKQHFEIHEEEVCDTFIALGQLAEQVCLKSN